MSFPFPSRMRSWLFGGMLLAALPLAAATDAVEQFNFATGLLIRGEPSLAADEFQKLVRDHPDFAELDTALYRWGESLAQADRPAEAGPIFERLLRERADSPRVPEAHYWLARLSSKEAPREAAGHYAAVFREAPESPLAAAARIGWADSLFQSEQWAECAKAADELLAAEPEGQYASHLRFLRAEALSKTGDTAAAVEAYQDFAARFPDDPQTPRCRLRTADGLRELERHEAAAEAYAGLLDAPPPLGGEARIGRAFSLHALGRSAEAAETFLAAAAQLDPDDARTVVCRMNAGHAFAAAGEPVKAADAFDTVAKTEAADAGTRAEAERWRDLFRARSAGDPVFARWNENDHAGAAESAAAFLKDFPDDSRAPQIRQILAYSLLELDRPAEAADAFRAHLAALPPEEKPPADLLYSLGTCELRREPSDPAAVRDAFAKLAELHPDSPLAAEAIFRTAAASDAAGERDAAEAAYRRLLDVAPKSDFAPRALAELARRSLEAGRFDEALAFANRAATEFPQSDLAPFARLYAADALMALERFEEALEAYRQAGEADGTARDAALGAGFALRALERFDEAAAAFAPVADDDVPGRSEEALWWAACSLEDAGKFDEAARRQAAFARRFPGSPRAADSAFRHASCLYRLQDWDAADPLYDAFLKAHPDHPLAPQARYDWAWIALERGETEAGEARFRDLVGRHPGGELEADAGFRLGEIAFDAGRHADAAKDYEAALAIPDLPFADKLLYKLGWARTHLDEKEAALEAFRRLSRDFPDSELAGEARYLQGKLLAELGRPDEAAAALEGVADEAFAGRALFLRAESLRAAGRHADAIAAYSKILENPAEGGRYAAALLGKGHSLRASGAAADAMDAYAAAVATDHESAEAAQAILGQGDLHFEAERWTDAAKAYLKVDILYGYEEFKPRALLMLSRAWARAGEEGKAAQYLSQLRARYPDSPEAKEAP
ncbi:MAG: tetratricopeptide repeat protein [Kiritimatiellia bacterium]|jgi:TolA-binding protein